MKNKQIKIYAIPFLIIGLAFVFSACSNNQGEEIESPIPEQEELVSDVDNNVEEEEQDMFFGLDMMTDQDKDDYGISLSEDIQVIQRDANNDISAYKFIFSEDDLIRDIDSLDFDNLGAYGVVKDDFRPGQVILDLE